MNALIMDTNFEFVCVLDDYESFIWSDRYNAYGDMEIYAPVEAVFYQFIKDGYYVCCSESEHVMIVDEIEIDTDVESGNHLTVKGRSLESILERRIIWEQTVLDGNFQNGIKKLLTDSIISPAIAARKIPNFIFKESTDERITALTVQAQFTGDNLYDSIKALCEANNVGFKVTLNDSFQFVFELYIGTDRSYEQTTVPYVIFSSRFDNIINSNYYESKKDMKNVALVGGEGEGSERRYTTVNGNGGDDTTSGLDRRELFVDARDISSKVDDKTLTEEEYTAQLKERGADKLLEVTSVANFEGEVDATQLYVYGRDFFIGDIVEVANEYGKEGRSRVSEVMYTNDTSGISIVPTFTTV